MTCHSRQTIRFRHSLNRPGFVGGSNSREVEPDEQTTNKFASEVRERAVRIVFDHERDLPFKWATVVSIAEKIGCVLQTQHEWVKKAEVDSGKRSGVLTEVTDKVKALERE